MGKFLWPTIFWNGAWHFTNIGDVAAVNLKFSTSCPRTRSRATDGEEYKSRLATLKKCPLAELPRAIQQDRFAHLIA